MKPKAFLCRLPGKGKGLVSSQSIGAGEVILSETPLASCSHSSTACIIPSEAPISLLHGAPWPFTRRSSSDPKFPLLSAQLSLFSEKTILTKIDSLCFAEIPLEASLEYYHTLQSWSAFPIPSHERFTQLLGKVHLNALSLDEGSVVVHSGSFFNHSCVPNTLARYNSEEKQVEFVSTEDIPLHQELVIAYTDPDRPTAERKEFLLWAYGFECKCIKCVS